MATTRGVRGAVFPIVEAFGYSHDATSPEAVRHQEQKLCPFVGGKCEKYIQYKYGYCSVRYTAADDAGTQYVYSVCDHRLDGEPIRAAVHDYFGVTSSEVRMVSEIEVPHLRSAIDYAAITLKAGKIADVIAIESQAIDLRGGGVGPAWRAWEDGKPDSWRAYFTEEATRKGRKDQVAYGVNTANIYKRLGLQVAVKGEYLAGIGVPLYVVMQDRIFQYLKRRIAFAESKAKATDITFITFDYDGTASNAGMLGFRHVQTARTTLASYLAAITSKDAHKDQTREAFLSQVERKAGLGD